ncbi:MAG: hypothetical protein HYZ28_16800 [Myxococcales bacterium]|nr:hypothetical protein [Myxococcales bacterium]
MAAQAPAEVDARSPENPRFAPFAAPLAAAACVALSTLGNWWQNPAAVPVADLPRLPLARALARWDAGWYGEIAQNGYWMEQGQQSPVAFFPLYPLAIRALAVAGANRWWAGIALTLAAGLAAAALFRRWAAERSGQAAAGVATCALVLYPFAFYLYGVVYSDALFLLLSVGAFLALERGRPLFAGLLGALATATRPVAPAVVLGLVVRSIERRLERKEKLRPADFLPALAVAGIAGYMLYLGLRFGDPLAFAHVQSAPGWDQPAGPRTWLKLAWFEMLFPRVDPWVALRLFGHALVTLAALAMAFPTKRLLGWGYAVYAATAVGVPALGSKDFQGMGRYVMAAFPIFLALGLLLRDRPRLRAGWLGLSAALLGLLAFAFGAGAYVS